MIRINSLFFLLLVVYFSNCKRDYTSQLLITKTTYTYKGNDVDSTSNPIEEFRYTKDSIILFYRNIADNYYYRAKYNKEKHLILRNFFSGDHTPLYSVIAQLDAKGNEIESYYYNNNKQQTYVVMRRFDPVHNQMISEENIFADNTKTNTQYLYDKHASLIQKNIEREGDLIEAERHTMHYDVHGNLLTDTVYSETRRSIIKYTYATDNQLISEEEHIEYFDPNAKEWRHLNEVYQVKKYAFNKKFNCKEIAYIQHYYNSDYSTPGPRISMYYNNSEQPIRKSYYNANNQKLYTIYYIRSN